MVSVKGTASPVVAFSGTGTFSWYNPLNERPEMRPLGAATSHELAIKMAPCTDRPMLKKPGLKAARLTVAVPLVTPSTVTFMDACDWPASSQRTSKEICSEETSNKMQPSR